MHLKRENIGLHYINLGILAVTLAFELKKNWFILHFELQVHKSSTLHKRKKRITKPSPNQCMYLRKGIGESLMTIGRWHRSTLSYPDSHT